MNLLEIVMIANILACALFMFLYMRERGERKAYEFLLRCEEKHRHEVMDILNNVVEKVPSEVFSEMVRVQTELNRLEFENMMRENRPG